MTEGRRWPRRLLIVVAAVVALAVVATGAGYLYLRHRFDQIDKVHVPTITKRHEQHSAPPSQPMNILVVGSDTRAVAGNDAQSFGSAQQVAGQRADVIKIVHLDPAGPTARVLSVPRDLVVTLPGTSREAKINDAFMTGPDRLIRAVQQATGVPIDHYVLVNFEGFEKVVDALDGVKLNFPVKAYDTMTGLRITSTGCHLLNGKQALAVARSRHYHYFRDGRWHYDPTSDLGRIKRQDAFLRAVIRSAKSSGLSHPLKANAFLGAVVKHLQIDDTWSVGDLIGLARRYRGFDPSGLDSRTLPTRAVNGYRGLGDVLLPQQQADRQAVSWLLRGPQPAPAPSGTPSAGPSPQPAQPAPEPYNPRPC